MNILKREVRLVVRRAPKGPYLVESMDEVLERLEKLGYPRRKLWSQILRGDEVELSYKMQM